MDEWEMAEAIAYALSKWGNGSWKAKAELGDIEFENEDGEKFRLVVEKIEEDD